MIRHFVLSILANSAAIYGVAYFLPDDFQVQGGLLGYLLISICLGLLNTVLKPLLKIISFPFVLVSMGLFLVVINMGILWMTEWVFDNTLSALDVGISIIGGWTSYLFTAIALSVLNTITHWILR